LRLSVINGAWRVTIFWCPSELVAMATVDRWLEARERERPAFPVGETEGGRPCACCCTTANSTSLAERFLEASFPPGVVCRCLGVTEEQLEAAVDRQSLHTLGDVISCTGAGAGCMSCHERIRQFLAARAGKPATHLRTVA
jgi:NifU-like protein